ncbi:unnamed protein product [Rhodiola kirilowii]
MSMSFSPTTPIRSFLQSKSKASGAGITASLRGPRCKGSDYVKVQSTSTNASAWASSSSYVRIEENVGRLCGKAFEKKLMNKRVGVVRCATIEEIAAHKSVVEKDVKERMEKTIENVKTNFNSIRTGRASPSMLDRIEVEYYGTPVSLKSIAQISSPDGSSILVQPYDKSSLKLIEKAIVTSDLGVSPNNDGEVIRLTVPQPTADRRKELLKIVAKQNEEGKVALRNIRRDGVKVYEKLEKEKKLSEDNVKDLEADLKKVLDEYLKKLDDVYKQKEKELLKLIGIRRSLSTRSTICFPIGTKHPLDMALILHSWATNKNAYKALIAAEYNESYWKGTSVGDSRWPYIESNAIARYVTKLKADNPLFGSSLIDYGHIEQWIDFASLEIDTNIGSWLRKAAITALKRALGALNSYLAYSTYLVGHSVTLADIIMTCNLFTGFANIMTKNFTSEFPHVERYFWTLVNQPIFSKIIGEVKQAESVPPVAGKKPAQQKEAAKPRLRMSQRKSPMVLDDWKRLYSNTKSNFREVAIKGFWDMYDPEGYSLWFCDYKYNDENTVSFVTLNKVGGFLQRMDLARKYAFGKMLIIGSEPPYKVKGLWLFRGQEIPKFIMDECYDMELYEWKKVDINDEEQKERVSQMIEDHEPFEGEALLDAKCFK